MNLDHIKTEKCPYCGESTVIREDIEVYNGKVRIDINGIKEGDPKFPLK